jgi:uncharacterized small protein (DUF1192 family)
MRKIEGALASRAPTGNRSQFQEEDMPSEDDDRPRKKVSHEIGQDLSLISVDELNERIALLSSEIERLRAAVNKRNASKDAAKSFFKS